MKNKEELGKVGFEAYNAMGPNPGKAHDGKPVPGWNDFAPDRKAQVQGKWSAAASAVAKQVIEDVFADIERDLRIIGASAKQGLSAIKKKHLARLR